MGLILDSTVLTGAERKGQTAREALIDVAAFTGGEEVAISIITVVELMHGVVRANTPRKQATRRQFLDEVMLALPIHPVSIAVALRSGQIDGENAAKGLHLSMSDLLIGVTALDLGYTFATANERHFRMVPGLDIAVF